MGVSIGGQANVSSFVFDPLGRITGVTNPLGQFIYQYVNQTRRIRSIAFPNGQKTNFSYYPDQVSDGSGNEDERLQSIQNLGANSATLSSFNYTYDVVGNILSWSKTFGAGTVAASTFGYDAANQLASAIVPNPQTQAQGGYFYSYDQAGNRTQEQVNSTINTSSYNSTNEYSSEAAGGAMVFEGSVSVPATVSWRKSSYIKRAEQLDRFGSCCCWPKPYSSCGS